MGDRFDDLAERVQLDCESYVMRGSIDGRRRVIREALVAAHAIGKEEADEALVRGMDQMRMLSKLPLPIDIVDEITRLRADLARVTDELDEAIEDRRQARDDAARAAALLAVRTMERELRHAIETGDYARMESDDE